MRLQKTLTCWEREFMLRMDNYECAIRPLSHIWTWPTATTFVTVSVSGRILYSKAGARVFLSACLFYLNAGTHGSVRAQICAVCSAGALLQHGIF